MSQSDFATRFVTTDVLDAHDKVITSLTGLIGRVDDNTMDAPTPCARWTVRDLLCHLAFINERYTAVASRSDDPPFSSSFFLDPVVAFAEWSSKARTAFHAEKFLTTVIPTPIGEHPGEVVVQHVINELMAHSWDLATALGVDQVILPDIAEQALKSWTVAYAELGNPPRSSATMDLPWPVAEDASPNAKLAAFLGRNPNP